MLREKARDDADGGQREAKADDPLSGNADLEHRFVGVEEAEEHVGEQIHDRCSAEHDHNGDAEGEFQGFVDSLFLSGAVVVGQDGDQSVVETEDRHEEEALQLEVDAEDRCSSRGEGCQDHVHAVGHDRRS